MFNKILNIIVILLFFSSFTSKILFAEGSQGVSGADFLEIGVGSRPLAMGEAFTATTEDINAIYYNPAGLGTLKYPVLSMHHQELILDSRFENITGSIPLYGGFFGISSSVFWVPPFEKIDIDGNEDGKVNFYNSATTFAYGRALGPIYLGSSLKYIYQKIDTLNVHSAAVDFGIMKNLYMYSPFASPTNNFTLGMSVLNLGTKAKDDPLPRTLRMGMSYLPTHWMRFNVDITENFIYSSDLYDFTYGFDESFRVNTGIELSYLELIALRAGYRFNDAGTYTFGVGFNFVIEDVSFIIDTSYADTDVFGPVYSVNLTFKLIPKVITNEDKRNAEKYYQSGIKQFVADDIDSSIDSFRKAKDYNPYHKNIDAKIQDLEELQDLKEQNKKYEEKEPEDEEY